ncbi:MAG TPA: hypothetical protein PKX94_09840 [Opitutales bacterium]|nr:hypothetical protein [Opitutales bacterium]
MTPSWIYVYVGTPTKAIIGRLPIQKMEFLPLNECIRHSAKGAITKDDLSKYASGYAELFVFTVAEYQAAKTAVELEYLKERYAYSPPQNFLVLSKQGKQALDELCGF